MVEWDEYEELVRALLIELASVEHVFVYPKKKYLSRPENRPIEIDVSFEINCMGLQILGLVECKNYKRRIGAKEVRYFAGVVHDVGAQLGLMFTTRGYQLGAIKLAEAKGIKLLIYDPASGLSLERVIRGEKDDQTRNLCRGLLLGERSGESGKTFASANELIRLLIEGYTERKDEPEN